MPHSEVVDSHIHLWDQKHTPQPWMTQEHAPINRPFGPDDIVPLLDHNGIGQVIVVQGACLDSDTDYLIEEASRSPWIAAVTGWVSLTEPERAAARIDELSLSPKFRAVRHSTQDEPDHWLLRAPVLESLAILEERDLILELPLVWPRHFDDVLLVTERFPQLRIVIDHLGKPPIGNPDMRQWQTALAAIAGSENVFAKVSGLNTAILKRDWTADDLKPAVEAGLDCFGAARLLCGSDWPYSLLNGEFDRVWGLTAKVLVETSPADADALLGGNASRLYRLHEYPGTS
jgi:L-fuconolactonase